MEKSKKQAEQLNEQLVNGKISINDARKVLGLKPIENADEKFLMKEVTEYHDNFKNKQRRRN